MKEKELYEFGQFRLNVTEHFLVCSDSDDRVQLSEKAFETLCVLVRNAGHLVQKDELLNQVWAESFVEENNLNKCIHAIRRALKERAGEQQFIETVQKHGYRFVAEVRRVQSEETVHPVHQDNGFQARTKLNSPTEFPLLSKQAEGQNSGAVVALADWRREADGNEAVKLVSASTAPEVSTETTTGPELSLAKPGTEIKLATEYRWPLVAFVLGVFLIGAIALGYRFLSAGKTTSIADGKKSIAVLPLKPINAANRDEIYEIGIADSLIVELSSMKGFIVRPLSATRKYTDIGQDALTAGREQKVNYVLVSNYQLADGKIKLTAQLINVANGQTEDTYKIERDAGDIFAMQDAIAGEVSNRLQARFATSSSSLTAKHGTTNEEAYRLYLQGRNLTYNRTPMAAQKAVEYFEQAIRLDPGFARAYSAMAHALITSGNLGGDLPLVEYEKAKVAVTKALELDHNLGEGHAVLGELKFTYEWDFAGAEKDLLRAIELEPNSDLAHERYAFYLAVRGRFDEAIGAVKTAEEINPNSLQHQQIESVILYLARRYGEAIIQLRRIIEVNENHATAYAWLFLACDVKGDTAGAYEWFMKLQKRTNVERVEHFQRVYETSGWPGVRKEFFELNKVTDQKPSANSYAMARQSALIGDKEQAFAYLNKAIEKRQGQMVMLNVEPAFDILRNYPRFDELVRRVGLK